MISLKIETLDGKASYDFDEDFNSMPKNLTDIGEKATITEEKVDGQSGLVLLEKTLNGRNFQTVFATFANDEEELDSIIGKINEVLKTNDQFYLISSTFPGKRALVTSDGPVLSSRIGSFGEFDLVFHSSSPFIESANKWTNRYTTSSFLYKNEGTTRIDPNKHPETEIEFKGASSNLIIRNLTTSDMWSYSGMTIVGDIVLLKNSRSLKNGESILGQTNKKLITLVPGWNDFEVVGATGDFELTIRSHFYFL